MATAGINLYIERDRISHPIRNLSKQNKPTFLSIDPKIVRKWLYGEKKYVIKEQKTFIHVIGSTKRETNSFIMKIREGLKLFSPELITEGVNGSYFLKDIHGNNIAIFKPEDEEGKSPNNPKKSHSFSSFQGIYPGEGPTKEVAAYLLDQDRFYGVPMTLFVEIKHPIFLNTGSTKKGSLQEYVENDGASWEIGSSFFPTSEVHKIGILDIQIINLDRHGGNILFRNTGNDYKLIPIDNGFSLPHSLKNNSIWFEWMNWKASRYPFDSRTKQFIQNIDLERNISMLKQKINLHPECLKMLKVGTTLLKKGVEAGLTLFDIGSLLCSTDQNQPSKLDLLLEKAKKLSGIHDEFPFFVSLLDQELTTMINPQ